MQTTLSAGDIARLVDAELVGDASATINGAATLEQAGSEDLSFVGDTRNVKRLAASKSLVVLVPASVRDAIAEFPNRTFVLVDEPEAAFLTVLALLMPRRPRPAVGISDRAVIDPSVRIGPNTNVHPHCVIGRDVVIGRNCDLHSGVVIGDGCRIGDAVEIHANSVLYPDVIVEDRVIIHASCVLGADGFGYRLVDGRHERLPHFGTVRIGRDVEIGAGTTIDRAKVGETTIGEGTKIDNQVMIGHNCRVGKHNLLVSQVGFAGSVSTGNYVVCAGQAGIADHVHLHDGVIVGAKAGVHRDLAGGQAYLGIPATPAAESARQSMALRRLPALRDALRQLEKQVTRLEQRMTNPGDSAEDENRTAA